MFIAALCLTAVLPQVSKPTTEMVEVRDPVEDCFTVKVPKGWMNRAYSARTYDIHREVVTCVSPNSDTVIFLGDPSIPQYWSPAHANPITYEFAKVNPVMRIENFRPAEVYWPDYAKRKFGKLEGFSLGNLSTNDEMTGELKATFKKHGVENLKGEVVNLPFTYKDKGKPMSAILMGISIDLDSFWIVDVWGISTAGKAENFMPMLLQVARSKKTNPEWTQKQQQRHQAIMAQIQAHGEMMNAQHQRNMEWIQASASRHQQRMQSIWAASDASVKSYYERSAASDMQHQRFLNFINNEHTVVDSSGKTWQVDNSYQRYFVHKTNNSYLGGDIRFDLDEIRRRGLNPDDYKEVKIRN